MQGFHFLLPCLKTIAKYQIKMLANVQQLSLPQVKQLCFSADSNVQSVDILLLTYTPGYPPTFRPIAALLIFTGL